MTREEWLTQALASVETTFALDLGDRPTISVGHPAKQGRKVRLWDVATDVSGGRQVYVSPYLADPAEVLAVVLFAAVEVAESTPRARAARRRGLGFTVVDGKPHAVVPGDFLGGRLADLAATLPQYPHVYTDPDAARRATQTTRMLKAECTGDSMLTAHDAYVVRLSRTQADRGMPRCGVCGARMILA